MRHETSNEGTPWTLTEIANGDELRSYVAYDNGDGKRVLATYGHSATRLLLKLIEAHEEDVAAGLTDFVGSRTRRVLADLLSTSRALAYKMRPREVTGFKKDICKRWRRALEQADVTQTEDLEIVRHPAPGMGYAVSPKGMVVKRCKRADDAADA